MTLQIGDLIPIGKSDLEGKKVINFFIQDSEPLPIDINDVWVKTDKNLKSNDIIFSSNQPYDAFNNQIWQTVTSLDSTLHLDNINNYFRKNFSDLHVELETKTLIDNIPSHKIKLWENAYSKVFGLLSDTHYWNLSSNEWEKVESYIWNGNEWEQISYLGFAIYDKGLEYIPFVQGYRFNASTFTLYTDRINLRAYYGSAYSQIGAVTDTTVDLTPYKKAFIEWENIGTARNDNLSRFVVSPNKTAQYLTASAFLEKTNTFERVVEEVDISSLSGDYYIRVHAIENNSSISMSSEVNVYKIWLE